MSRKKQRQPKGRADSPARKATLRRHAGLIAGALVAVVAVLIVWHVANRKPSSPPIAASAASSATAPTPAAASVPAASYAGGKACGTCHATEYSAWLSSQHHQAMQEATEQTVLGDFAGATYAYAGTTTTFFKRDGRFFVNTDGPDGGLHDYEIKYTFGVSPLQQYLVEFADGRMQALPLAWDTRPAAAGGQHWFHLYPNERVTHEDELHWTRRSQNWNWMCARCHSTDLRRNYDLAANRYATTWAELNVSCEACHGPGSQHVQWAEKKPGWKALEPNKGLVAALDERKGVTWHVDTITGQPVRSAVLATHREVEACAQCHARSAPFAAHTPPGSPLMETQDPVLLREGLYFADGQQQDEVYNYGSFVQSRMYAHGVTCADCHDPHAGTLRAPGNAVCTQCHLASRYDAQTHTLHAAGTAGAQCVGCHMPPRTYMVIDPRHDHSIRIPRPDESVRLGTPNACNECHRDRSAAWAAAAIERAYGPERKGFQAYAVALDAGRRGLPGAVGQLAALAVDARAPAIARATAVAELARAPGPPLLGVLEAAVGDVDPLVRGAAMDALSDLPLPQRVQLAVGLLDDPVRVVRLKAARALAVLPSQGIPPGQRSHFEQAYTNYVASQEANAELPEAHLNLGLFYVERRQFDRAEAEYRTAARLDPDFVPAYLNLADLYRGTGRDSDAEAVLDAGRQRHPDDGDLAHALGLLRIRQGRRDEALGLLAQAVERRPTNAQYAYVHAVALHDLGHPRQARGALALALERFPYDPNLLGVAMNYAREAGDRDAQAEYERRFDAVRPDGGAPGVSPDAQK
jgi:Flp pilus assembly protein TadD